MSEKKEKWVMPPCPKGYNEAVVMLGTSGAVRLDFINEDAKGVDGRVRVFTIDETETKPKWEWPWVAGFAPTKDDWKAIGFRVERLWDNCFGSPAETSFFEDWTGKE